jgi:hypothetical protein
MDINKFRKALGIEGGARANLYAVDIDLPLGLQNSDTRNFRYLCKSTSFPSSNIGSIDIAYAGRIIPIPGDRTFEDWTTTLYNTTSFAGRDALEEWSNIINNYQNAVQSSNNPYGVATVSQLNRQGSIVKKYKFYDIWPQNISSIEVSHDSSDTLEEYSVTWKYTYFRPENTGLGGFIGGEIGDIIGSIGDILNV